MIKIIIPTIFVSVNNQWGKSKYGNVFLTTEAKAYKEHVAWIAKQTYKGVILTDPLKVFIYYYFKDKRRRDILNDKLTFDALEGIVYKDDKQITDAHIYKRYDPKNCRTVIKVDTI